MSRTLRNVRINLWALPLLLCAKGAVGKARLAFCSTPKTLAAAITDGTPHVVLTAHMDLTSLPLQRTASGHHVIFEVPAAVKSITVRAACSSFLLSLPSSHRIVRAVCGVVARLAKRGSDVRRATAPRRRQPACYRVPPRLMSRRNAS